MKVKAQKKCKKILERYDSQRFAKLWRKYWYYWRRTFEKNFKMNFVEGIELTEEKGLPIPIEVMK